MGISFLLHMRASQYNVRTNPRYYATSQLLIS
jgi:hypothetical protein